METSDWLVLGVVGVGAYWLYQRSQAAPQPAVDGNPAGAASMHAAAAAVTKTGTPNVKGLVGGGATFSMPRSFGSGSSPFRTEAAKLLALNLAPKPVALVPTVQTGTTTGVLPTPGQRPPPQRLNPTINPSASVRGVS